LANICPTAIIIVRFFSKFIVIYNLIVAESGVLGEREGGESSINRIVEYFASSIIPIFLKNYIKNNEQTLDETVLPSTYNSDE
jgi:hypothetical protein